MKYFILALLMILVIVLPFPANVVAFYLMIGSIIWALLSIIRDDN